MRSSFRFVDAARDTAVNLFLFKSPSGMAQAVVMGPALDRISEDVVCPFVPLPLDKAFAVAIRAANRNDVEILVSGDRSLWDDRWGWLTRGPRRSRSACRSLMVGMNLEATSGIEPEYADLQSAA